jgi:hypothetical protein
MREAEYGEGLREMVLLRENNATQFIPSAAGGFFRFTAQA